MQLLSRTNFGVVILAAGASRRMGRQKLLLPWNKTTVLAHLLCQWNSLGAAQIGVVCAENAVDVQSEFSSASAAVTCPSALIYNSNPERGMFSSIRCAAQWKNWNADLTHWVVSLGDQPHLRMQTLRALLDFSAAHPESICQPMRGGRPKHPVVLPKSIFLQLRDSTAADLKVFLASHEDAFTGFTSDDEGLDHDIDTPEDYVRLHKLFA